MKGSTPSNERNRAPGLDGIRGVAVLAITAYHLRLVEGGLLSVSVFFTLSGWLITSILLSELQKHGRVDLKAFWVRRARRLLPALFVVLSVVLAATAIARPTKLSTYGKQALAACLYVANWATIARGDDYFDRFSGPSPFDHLWSLAIEEQFYVVWPIALLLLVGRRGARRLLAAAIALALAVISAATMAWLHVPDAINNTRAYEGTDARAAPLLVGAATALLLPLDRVAEGGRARRIVLDLVGAASSIVVVMVVARVDEHAPLLYRGGEAIVSVATAALLVAAAHPHTLVGRLLGLAPFRWLGVRSYGIYLWHMPIVAFVPAALLADRSLARAALQLVLIVGVAALSFVLVEEPVRRHGLAALVRAGRRSVGLRLAGAIALFLVATAALVPWPFLTPAGARDLRSLSAEVAADARSTPSASSAAPQAPPEPDGPLVTSCSQVVHVGDSTSLALVAKSYLPDENDRLIARYRAVGVKVFVSEIAGGRAIVERYGDDPSAYEVVVSKEGYSGCWVFALGNGDTANVSGNGAALGKRIDWMMKRVTNAPVLWTTIKTTLSKGPYRQAQMQTWNDALALACTRHPNMRVYDWASEVEDGWFLEDGIHPNAVGAKERALRIAKALAIAFPKSREAPATCFVRTTH